MIFRLYSGQKSPEFLGLRDDVDELDVLEYRYRSFSQGGQNEKTLFTPLLRNIGRGYGRY